MPLLDFYCTNCGKEKETLLKDPKGNVACECGILMTRRVGKTSFNLKGSGWAKDGYTNK